MFGFGLSRHLKVRGVVAEHCSYCNGPRPMEVVDDFLGFHALYVVPLGDGSLMGTTVRCPQCGSSFVFVPEAYQFVMPVEAAATLPFATLLHETNQRLAAALPPGQALREAAPAPQLLEPAAPPPSAEVFAASVVKEVESASERDGRLQSAYRLLDAYISDPQARPLFVKLDRWAKSAPAERDALFAQIEQFAAQGAVGRRLDKFVVDVSWSFPHRSGCLPFVLAYAAALSPLLWWPATRSWLWTPLLVAGAFVPALVAFGYGKTWSLRRWCRRELIPRAARENIDLADVVSYLAGVDRENKEIGERVRDMAGDADDIAAELARVSALPEESALTDTAAPGPRAASPEQLETLQRMYVLRWQAAKLDRKTHLEKIAAAIRTVPVQVLPPEFDNVLRAWDIQTPGLQTTMFNLAKVWLDERLLSEQLLVIRDLRRRTYPKWPGMWTWVMGLAACGIWPWLVPATRHWAWGPLAMIAGFVAWTIAFVWIKAIRGSNWWRRMPKMAEARGVDFDILADVAEIDSPTADERGDRIPEDRRKSQIALAVFRDYKEQARKKREEIGVPALAARLDELRSSGFQPPTSIT